MIYFRADGNSEIGMGHVMRCLSIAKACIKNGGEVAFITAARECVETIEGNGIIAKLLPTDYTSMESEIPYLQEIIKENNKTTHVFVVDSYQMTNEYVRALKKLGKVCCLDDMGNTYPSNMLINYNIYAPSLEYNYEDRKPKLLLGASYAPIREEFLDNNSFKVKDEAKNVMITTGGSDPMNATTGLLNTFLKNNMLNRRNIVYHVVIGPMNPYAGELHKQFDKEQQVVLHENVKSMKELMEQCDVIITATGSTVYEACAVGIPMICFYYAENQRRIAEFLDKNTDVINCGDYAFSKQLVCFNANDALVRCVIGKDTRRELHEQEKRLVDGEGADRISKEILALQS